MTLRSSVSAGSAARFPLWRVLEDPVLILVWGFAIGILMWGSGVDVAIQVWLDTNYNQDFNTAMRVLGSFGKGSNQAALCIVFVMLWFARNRWLHKTTCNMAQLGCVLMAVPVFLLAGALNWILKWGIGRGRPKEFLWNGADPFLMNPFEMTAQWWSFPSGHTCSTFAIGTWLALAFPRHRVLFLTVSTLLSFSRFLALTPHYAGDVVAGASVGAAVALAVWRAHRLRRDVGKDGV
jgi:membrane-associated phospholipid phosphatase